ncbi:MAG: sulfurtransferase [Burkholderiales bacterium]|nr:MAG: sulfurtransferase [Burkholderiales bacterium]
MSYALLVDTATLAAHLDDPDWVVVDCRSDPADPDFGRAEYAKGHLPGAIFLDVDSDLCGAHTGRNGRHPLPDPDRLAATLGAAGIDPRMQVVAYDDRGGASAARLWWLLRWLGHRTVAVLDGGLPRWLADGRPVTTAVPQRTSARFEGRPRDDAMVDSVFVLAHLGSGDAVLVDARAPARYRGESEPIDPIAGRIPGAHNRPLTMNLDAGGAFRAPAALRAEFESVLDGAPPERVIHYCGSGVGSCHNVLAMEVAGLRGSRLYPGSWSEWIADPSRPVDRG